MLKSMVKSLLNEGHEDHILVVEVAQFTSHHRISKQFVRKSTASAANQSPLPI